MERRRHLLSIFFISRDPIYIHRSDAACLPYGEGLRVNLDHLGIFNMPRNPDTVAGFSVSIRTVAAGPGFELASSGSAALVCTRKRFGKSGEVFFFFLLYGVLQPRSVASAHRSLRSGIPQVKIHFENNLVVPQWCRIN